MANQLDLPPVSFARYLDLLKRRRWQVIPASLGGLLVGAFVAFLIPRYYVASTRIAYTGALFDVSPNSEDDEFVPFILYADQEIPNKVEDTLLRLGFIGPKTSEEDRLPRVESAQDRVEVSVNQRAGGRGFEEVVIQYKDTDGPNSAAFTNELAEVWIQSIVDDLAEGAKEQLTRANSDFQAAQTTLKLNIAQRSAKEQRYGIDSRDPRDAFAAGGSLNGQLSELNDRVTTWELELISAENKEARLLARLRNVDKELPIRLDDDAIPDALRIQIQRAQAGYERAQQAAAAFNPGRVERNRLESRAREYKKELDAALAELESLSAGRGTNENPAYKEIQQSLELAKLDVKGFRDKIEKARARIRDLNDELAALPEAQRAITELEGRAEFLQEDLDEKQRIRDRLEKRVDQIESGQLFRRTPAVVPPVPTDPNIVVVALTGSIVGLAVAIGLVLLIDILRSTYKTIDDVAYAVQIPILGSMAYLETADEQKRVSRARRRIAIAAGSFFVVLMAIVAIYHLDKTRLPTGVADFLDQLLQPGE